LPVDVPQSPVGGIFDNHGPSLVGFSKSDRIGVPDSAIPSQCFTRHFRNVWATDDDRNAGFPKGIGHTVGFGDHPGHGPNANEIYPLAAYETHQLLFVHRACVAVNQ
jgi:hypothetical protein